MIVYGTTGSRSIKDQAWVFQKLTEVIKRPAILITGVAEGPDTFVTTWGRSRKYNVFALKSANKYFSWLWQSPQDNCLYYARDYQVVDNCQILIAFWDGGSVGTKKTMDYAKKCHKPIHLFLSETKSLLNMDTFLK